MGRARAIVRTLTTVLFTDIVDSTGTIARIGDVAWRTLKSQYDEKVSAALASHDGTLVDTSGDGALARFGSAAAAVRAAQAIVAGAERVGLPTRAGSTPAKSSSRKTQSAV